MKKNWDGQFQSGLQELSKEETVAIVGGESLWFWVGYGVGLMGYALTHASGAQSAGQQAANITLN